MRLLVNTLSIGSLSGQHVAYGHLEQLARWSDGVHEIVVLHGRDADVSRVAPLPGVSLMAAPAVARHWSSRSVWEAAELPSIMRRGGINAYFSPSGTILPRSPVPQATLAQNPWCLVPALKKSLAGRGKALLQRMAYRRAFVGADLMIYNSDYMRALYQRNAPGRSERSYTVAYQGIDEETFASAGQWRGKVEKRPLSILLVSVMAPWKGAEVVVEALRQLRLRGIDARLTIVGPWADASYRTRIDAQIASDGLQSAVEIAGRVTKEELHQQYARAKVFCLMSRCESFGIPAVEAQAFGTPVVGSSVCAMAEICGEGALCTTPDRPDQVAHLLEKLLLDEDHWEEMSGKALRNAERFRWEVCSRPLRALFDLGTLPEARSRLASLHHRARPNQSSLS